MFYVCLSVRFSRAMASVGAKLTTNLAGLAVARNPHHSLGVLYSKTLRALAKMPNEYAYRKNTEQVTTVLHY